MKTILITLLCVLALSGCVTHTPLAYCEMHYGDTEEQTAIIQEVCQDCMRNGQAFYYRFNETDFIADCIRVNFIN